MSLKNKSLLVFASKDVGLQVVKYFIAHGWHINQLIVASRNERDLIRMAEKKRLPYRILSRLLCRKLVASEKRFDWLINAWSPHILTKSVLQLARHRVNLHPGILPRYRGNDQAAWTIINADTAGVALLEMNSHIDTAPVWAQKKVPYRYPIKGKDLHARLQKEVVALFKSAWPQLVSGKIRPRAQRGRVGFHTRKVTNRNRRIRLADFNHPAAVIRRILAHDFSPKTTAELRFGGKSYQLTLTPVQRRRREKR